MKVAITLLALVALSYSAPQPRKLSHEHYEDFASFIIEEVGKDIADLNEQYYNNLQEFRDSIHYLVTPNFRNLVYEMEDLPEFKAVVDFLETHDIDINYFVDVMNSFVDAIQGRSLRQVASGRDMSAFIQDSIALFPNEKLTALYDQKVTEDEGFKRAMESFYTEEWKAVYSALWENETFLKEVATLNENGINVEDILLEAKAILGLN